MKKGTSVCLILYHIFRYYKRVDITNKREELLRDMCNCRKVLKHMKKQVDPMVSIKTIRSLFLRIHSLGSIVELEYPIRYADHYDESIVTLMIRVVDDIIAHARSPFYQKHTDYIFKKFLFLHNLPRVLLDDTSGDQSTHPKFHISKQSVMDSVVFSFKNVR